MNSEGHNPIRARYEHGAWRDEETTRPHDPFQPSARSEFESVNPTPRDRSRLLQLLGSINYKVLQQNRVYFEVDGVVYKTLWGLYWRSVFTGVEHYLLRCQPISGVWNEGNAVVDMIDLPISRTKEGWAAKGQSLNFMLNRE
jgi:hypothetical protein